MNAKIAALEAEIKLLRSRLLDESLLRVAEEESKEREFIQSGYLEMMSVGWAECFPVGKMMTQISALAKGVKRTKRDVGTDPPHQPVGRKAVPLEILGDVQPRKPSSVSSLSPERNRFSPQRYREPTTRADALRVVEEMMNYVHVERSKPSHIPIPTWVVERGEEGLSTLASTPSQQVKEGPDQVQEALSSFVSSITTNREDFAMELEKKQQRIAALSVAPPQLPRQPTAPDPAVARLRQKLQSLSNDIRETAQHAMSQKGYADTAKAELQAARLSLASAEC